VRNRPGGQADPEALFLQALAYSVLTLYFTQVGNQAGARVVLDDALIALAVYRPIFLGVHIDPIYATLYELKPLLAGLADNDPCPMFPFVYRKFEYDC
jgi:predicted neutral ceramidase superfamily lipid hydrolase